MEELAESEVSIFHPTVRQKVKTAMKIAFVSELIIGAMMVICCNVLYCYAWNAPPITVVFIYRLKTKNMSLIIDIYAAKYENCSYYTR